MSLNTKQDIWLTLAREKFPALSEDAAKALSMQAASAWYSGTDGELTELFDQYVMIKNIKGIDNGN